MADPNPPSGPIRCFAALALPDAVKSALVKQRERLQAGYSRRGVRWVEADQMHLTLRFFGNVAAAQVPAVTEALAASARTFSRFSLRTDQLGCFPNTRYPKVIWIGIAGDTQALLKLQSAVASATQSWGDAPAEKSFAPHLTLGRVKTIHARELAELNTAMEQLPALSPVNWAVNKLEFIQSTLGPNGPVYRRLAECPLAAAAP